MDDIFKITDKKKKVVKGYRLSPDTHKKIESIKKMLRTDFDDAINRACSYFGDALKSQIMKQKREK